MTIALELQQLKKTYPGGVQALRGIDLQVEAGDFYALLGPNGAGKSTTIGIISSLVNKTSGRVSVFGYDLEKDVVNAKRQLGLVPQEFNFNPFETVQQIVVNQAGYYGVERKEAYIRSEKYLKQLDLWGKRNERARMLSGGMKHPQGLRPVLSSDELLAHLPELNDLCIPETLALCSIDSTDLGQEHWLMMARAIQENYALYDGFIICHGTDTLAYSAAALSYLIQNADKPIILTGAQQPISNEITDAKKNLRDSVICALDPGSRGVMVVFGGHVIAGTRAKKNKTISYDAFASVNFPELALVQGDRLVRYVPSPWPTGPVEFGRAMNPRVFLLKLIPGMDPGMIPEIFRLYDCVIVESFGVGGIPQRLMDAFAEGLGHYEQTHKVLILTTQVTYEGSDVGVYEVGKRVKNRFRFLEAHDMTIEAVVTKSMWLLAQNCDSFDQLQQRFYRQVNFDTFYH